MFHHRSRSKAFCSTISSTPGRSFFGRSLLHRNNSKVSRRERVLVAIPLHQTSSPIPMMRFTSLRDARPISHRNQTKSWDANVHQSVSCHFFPIRTRHFHRTMHACGSTVVMADFLLHRRNSLLNGVQGIPFSNLCEMTYKQNTQAGTGWVYETLQPILRLKMHLRKVHGGDNGRTHGAKNRGNTHDAVKLQDPRQLHGQEGGCITLLPLHHNP